MVNRREGEKTGERWREEKPKRVSEEDRNSRGCVGRAPATGMHEEAASIPQRHRGARGSADHMQGRWPSTPSVILGLSATVVALIQRPHG